MQYELLYLVGGSKEADLAKTKTEVSAIVTTEGGIFFEKQVDEKRRLAYKVNHETHGIYVAQRFEMEDAEKMKSINKKLNLYTGILRFMITKASELPELLSRKDREAMAAAAPKIVAKEIQKEKPTPARKVEATEVSEPEKPAAGEDIDKKLEEILNI